MEITKNEIKNIIDAGGATLDAGGHSVTFRRGYQVSRRDCYTLNAENVNEIAGAVRDVLKRLKTGDFCGVWVDGGKCYIDISERIKNRKKAENVGRARRQISIYDWQAGECIFLNR